MILAIYICFNISKQKTDVRADGVVEAGTLIILQLTNWHDEE